MENTKFVYVITKGDYSDYHICAVTMDENRAEQLKKMYGGKYDEAKIETYTLDEAKTTGYVYEIEFKNDMPATICIDEYDGFGWYDKDPVVSPGWGSITVFVRAKDAAHALKIAQDKYAEWKAKQAGII